MSVHKVDFTADGDSMGGLRRIMGFTSSATNIRIYIIDREEGVTTGSLVISNKGFRQIDSIAFFKDYDVAVKCAGEILRGMAKNHQRLLSDLQITLFDKKFDGLSFDESLKWFETCGFFNVIHRHKIEVK